MVMADTIVQKHLDTDTLAIFFAYKREPQLVVDSLIVTVVADQLGRAPVCVR
jgi:hypothetical protein